MDQSTMNDMMATYTGLRFCPMDMKPENVRLEDIAHALSLLCRGGGHLKYFYSVGQHCINCAAEAAARGWSGRVVLACLLHDASEAYISDIIRPVKKHLTNYAEIENRILKVIFAHFGLDEITQEEWSQVRRIDDEILAHELKQLLCGDWEGTLPVLYAVPDLSCRDVREIEERYQKVYETIHEKI